MISFVRVFFLLNLTFAPIAIKAQPAIKTYTLKKGQVFDVLLRTNNDQASQETKDQFDREVIPRALKQGYQAMPSGLYFESVAIQGNYSPSHMVVGGWENLKAREHAMQILISEIPDFHQIRRDLWTTLFATYFEINEDINFSIVEGKLYVVTAYRHKKKSAFKKFRKEWANIIAASKGTIILTLENGKSPFIGHFYEPHHFTITKWDNRALFEEFLRKNNHMDHSSIQYVNQFVLQPRF